MAYNINHVSPHLDPDIVNWRYPISYCTQDGRLVYSTSLSHANFPGYELFSRASASRIVLDLRNHFCDVEKIPEGGEGGSRKGRGRSFLKAHQGHGS